MANSKVQVSSSESEQFDRDGWRDIFSRCIPQVYGIFARHGFHAHLAEELTQKTIFDAVRGLRTFDCRQGSPEGWLVGIARKNLAIELRRRQNRPKLNSDITKYILAIDTKPLPDEILERREMADAVKQAMANLDEKERQVLTAKYIEDLSARQICEIMGITEKAVHSLLYRARNYLREKLKKIRA